MAKPRNSTPVPLSIILLFFVFSASISTTLALGGERKVGGRTKIADVKTNKEVEELGRFCVEEYNKGLRKHQQITNGGGSAAVIFTEVVEAEKQVVSGIKYYLKISTNLASSGVPRTFNAIVVVKPWANSKELLNFTPSAATK